MRISRQWRDLKARMEFGLIYGDQETQLGRLAWFCPACPQPGLNLPETWMDDPEQYGGISGYHC
jgi:hypothetical protein